MNNDEKRSGKKKGGKTKWQKQDSKNYRYKYYSNFKSFYITYRQELYNLITVKSYSKV